MRPAVWPRPPEERTGIATKNENPAAGKIIEAPNRIHAGEPRRGTNGKRSWQRVMIEALNGESALRRRFV
jgi:hypothetical protein